MPWNRKGSFQNERRVPKPAAFASPIELKLSDGLIDQIIQRGTGRRLDRIALFYDLTLVSAVVKAVHRSSAGHRSFHGCTIDLKERSGSRRDRDRCANRFSLR